MNIKEPPEHAPTAAAKPWYKHWWGIAVLIFSGIWPFFLIWYVWAKSKWSRGVKLAATAVLPGLFILLVVIGAAFASPTITVQSPTSAAKDSQYQLAAQIDPSNSTVTVNGKQVGVDGQGKLQTTISLQEGDNTITIVATSGKDKVTTQTITVHRYTQSELAAQAKKVADDNAALIASDTKTADEKAAQDAADKAASDKAAADAAAKAAADKAAASVPAEYKSALSQATSYANTLNMSKQGVYAQLVSQYGGQFSAAAAQYAIDNVKADWNANALAKAKDYQSQQSLSPAAIHSQLTSAYGEKFTQAEADYAIQHLND